MGFSPCSQHSPHLQTSLWQSTCSSASVSSSASSAHCFLVISCGISLFSRPAVFWSKLFLALTTASQTSLAPSLAIIRAGSEETPRSFFHLAGGVLIAADCINDPQSFMAAKIMIAKRAKPDLGALADPEVAMKDVMKAALAGA